MRVLDAHHHLWDPEVGEYPWMTGDFAPLRRRVEFTELRPQLVANDVEATIVVQVRADLAETAGLLELASRTCEIVGVVGWVDMTSANVDHQIDELRAGTGGRYLVGLRHGAADELDPAWLARKDVDAAVGVLHARGLTFDLEITPRELAAANTLVARHPEMQFIVDHGAKPPISQGWSAQWAAGIAVLAEHPNVCCKLSGLATEASWNTWTRADLEPYVDHLLEVFGAGRLMFGSDWPVCELAATYSQVLTFARLSIARLSADDQRKILRDNALRIYQPYIIDPEGLG